MLPTVRQATIKPIITQAVAPGTLLHTDEYDIYARLPAWGYGHKTVCHAHGGVVQIRVILQTRNPLAGAALAPFSVTWSQ